MKPTVIGSTARGASHDRRGIANQDAHRLLHEYQGMSGLVVADGHGGAEHFRSDVGARIAVDVAQSLLDPQHNLSGNRDRFREWWTLDFAGRVLELWRKCVTTHSAGDTAHTPTSPDGHGVLGAYGTTLLSVLQVDQHLGIAQLGDGDIILVNPNGSVSTPWPLGQAGSRYTESLADECAEEKMRTLCMPSAEVQLVLASTDGWRNSFPNDEAFLQVGPDVLGMLVDHGTEAVYSQLRGWLQEASAGGSGDDITLCLLYNALDDAWEH